VLKNAPIVMANLDRDLKYTWVFNPKGGVRAEELIGKDIGQTTDAETAQRIRASLREVLAKGVSFQWEAARNGGGRGDLRDHADPLRNAGEIAGVAPFRSTSPSARDPRRGSGREALYRNANVALKESRRAALNLMDDAGPPASRPSGPAPSCARRSPRGRELKKR
jgi:hypothetical protein